MQVGPTIVPGSLIVPGSVVIFIVPARGSSDKNFRLCPSTDGRPYLLGFEKFLSGVTGRGWKEARDGLVASLRLRSHVSGEVQKSMTSTKQKTMPSTNIYMFITIGPMKKL